MSYIGNAVKSFWGNFFKTHLYRSSLTPSILPCMGAFTKCKFSKRDDIITVNRKVALINSKKNEKSSRNYKHLSLEKSSHCRLTIVTKNAEVP